MHTKRDWRDDENVLTPSVHPQPERHSQPLPPITSYPDKSESTYHDRDTESITYANIHRLEDDPRLAVVAHQLCETSSYGIDPSFTEKLRKNLLQQFIAYRTVEAKTIEGMDAIPSPLLPKGAMNIAVKERTALLYDQGKRLPRTKKLKPLEQASQEEGLVLHNTNPHLYKNDFEQKNLLLKAYKYIIVLLKRLYELWGKKTVLSKAWFRRI